MGPFSNAGIIFALELQFYTWSYFYLESSSDFDGALKAFNMTKEEAESTEKMAFNQDFIIPSCY